MDVWKIVGFELFESEAGDECVRLYLTRPPVELPGHVCAGVEAQREFYKVKYLEKPYSPALGDLIVPIKGRYGINNILVVGKEPVV